jgi:ribosomal protein S18 acetylase RimI-like enzyme
MKKNVNGVAVRRAVVGDRDVGLIAPLFDLYRQFYDQPSDPSLARAFIQDRLAGEESVIFLAHLTDVRMKSAAGFVQLYPSFSSVDASRIWILNDLFVAREARRLGVACALMERVRIHAIATAAKRVVLETRTSNRTAQSLYESLGYVCANKTEKFYALELPT